LQAEEVVVETGHIQDKELMEEQLVEVDLVIKDHLAPTTPSEFAISGTANTGGGGGGGSNSGGSSGSGSGGSGIVVIRYKFQ
jgi:hypothetical protein